MARIPSEVIDRIYAATDIVEVVGDYVQLKKKGRNYWGLSPFKAEKTPSFSVSPDKNIFKDFSSGKGGTVITFLIEMEGYTYVEALQHLARKYNIEIELEEGPSAEERDRRSSLFILNEWAKGWFETQLWDSEEGRTVGLSYYKERGFSEKTIREFALGYSPEAWEALTEAAKQKQFNEDFLTAVGLSLKSEKTGKLFDRFRGRVMFPLLDLQGRVAGFAGRILQSDAKAAKYVNSPEGPTYDKSNLLFGLHQHRQAIREAESCILVEGYTDVISLHQAGVLNVVASSGTALTPGQIRLIKRYAKQVYIVYDSDTAGINASLRGIDLVLEQGLDVKALHLPDGSDPDSYVKANGGSAFTAYLEAEGLDFVAFRQHIAQQKGQLDTPQGEAELVNEVAASIGRIPDEVQRMLWVRHAAERLKLSEELILRAANKALLQKTKQQAREHNRQASQEAQLQLTEQPAAKLPSNPCHYQEREILRIMLNHHEASVFVDDEHGEAAQTEEVSGEQVHLYRYILGELSDMPYDTPQHETIRRILLRAFQEGKPFPQEVLMNEQGPEIAELVTELMSNRHEISPNWEKRAVYVPPLDFDLRLALDRAIQHLQSKKIDLMVAENLRLIRETTDPEAQAKLMKRHRNLLRARKELMGELGTVVTGGLPPTAADKDA